MLQLFRGRYSEKQASRFNGWLTKRNVHKEAAKSSKDTSPPKNDKFVQIVVDTRPVVNTTQLQNALASIGQEGCLRILKVASMDGFINFSLTNMVVAIAILTKDSAMSFGHRHNFMELASFFTKVLRSFDFNGLKIKHSHLDGINDIVLLVRESTDLINPFKKNGWFNCMVEDQDTCKRISDIQHQVLFRLIAEEIVTEESKNIFHIDLDFPSDHLRRELKDIGNGSLNQGIIQLKSDAHAISRLAALLHVQECDLVNELNEEPESKFTTEILKDPKMRELECERIFSEYASANNTTSNGKAVSFEGFKRFLTDSNAAENSPEGDIDLEFRRQYENLCLNLDQSLSKKDFIEYYLQSHISDIRSYIRCKFGLAKENQILRAFTSFAGPRKNKHNNICVSQFIDSSSFFKLCRDSEIADSSILRKHVDGVFMKAKAGQHRKLYFDEFLVALTILADRLESTINYVVSKVISGSGPRRQSTTPEHVPLHDDRSKYTGIYARGGPDTKATVCDLRHLVDRRRSNTQNLSLNEIKHKTKRKGKLEITRPESPTMHTKYRVASSGPITPGRGASLAALEARNTLIAQELSTPTGSRAAFGRGETPKSYIYRFSEKIVASVDSARMKPRGKDTSASSSELTKFTCPPYYDNHEYCEDNNSLLPSKNINFKEPMVKCIFQYIARSAVSVTCPRNDCHYVCVSLEL